MKRYIFGLALLLLTFTSVQAQVIWTSGDYAKFLTKKGFYLNDGKYYTSLASDPSLGLAMPVGSVGVFDNAGAGTMWVKEGAANTAWASTLTTTSGWTTTGNLGTLAGTNYIGTNDAQDFVVKTNGLTQLTFKNAGGFVSAEFPTLTDGVGENRYQLSSQIIPTVATTTSSYINLETDTGYDSGLTGFGAGSIVENQSNLNIYGAGTINYVGGSSTNVSFPNAAGTTSLFKANDTNISVGNGYTVTDLYGVTSYVNTGTAANFNSVSLLSTGITLNDSTANNAQGLITNVQAQGTSAVGTINGEAITVRAANTAAVNQMQGASYSVGMIDTSTTNGMFGFNSNLYMQDATVNANGMVGMQSSVNMSGTASSSYMNGIQANIQVQGASTSTNVAGVLSGITQENTSVTSSLTGDNTFVTLKDTATTTNFNIATMSSSVEGSATATNYSGVNINSVLKNTATVTNMTPLTVSASIQDTAVVTSPPLLANIFANSVPSVPGITGLSVDIQSVVTPDYSTKTAITANGGAVQFGFGFDVPAANVFFGINNFSPNPTVVLGSPISSLGLGTNASSTVTFNDDWTADFTGARVGYANLAAAGQIIGSAGKTMDSYTNILATVSNPSGAGTLSKYTGVRVGGVSPGGGAIAVTDAYAFFADNAIGGFSATNNYGIFLDNSAFMNHMGGKTFMGAVYSAPLYTLEVESNNNESQVKVGPYASVISSFTGGGFLSNQSTVDPAGVWTARSTESVIEQMSSGNIDWFTDTALTPGNPFAPTPRMHLHFDGKLGIGTMTPAESLDVVGAIRSDTSLKLEDPGAGTFKTIIQSATLAADWTMTLPVDAGTNGYVLTTDGTGTTSWNAPGAPAPPNVVTKTANYTLTNADNVVLADASAGSFDLTLPSAAVVKEFKIKRIDGALNFVVNIVPAGGDFIDGDTLLELLQQNEAVNLISDGGTSWYLF